MKTHESGFTLVELVMVILIIAILSAFAISRTSDQQGYSTTIVKNQFIASARQAQQTALSRASSGNVSLTVSLSSGEWSFQVAGGGGDQHIISLEQGSERIRFGTNFSAACSALSGSTLSVQFDGDGNRDPSENLRVCIDSTPDIEMCISPAGYAYEGTCL